MLTGLDIKLYSVQRQGRIQSIIIIYAKTICASIMKTTHKCA